MNEVIYLNEKSKEVFRNLGCGIVDYITIYRTEGPKLFFSAGPGRFHMMEDELESYALQS
jgi:hypothetical protein